MKTLTLFLGLALGSAAPGFAFQNSADDLTRLFASCTGRYSAMMEHDWLMGRDGEGPRESRQIFEDLLDAVRADADLSGPDILHLRISAKHAHARLLQMADLQSDQTAARRAFGLVQQHMGQCRAVLLG